MTTKKQQAEIDETAERLRTSYGLTPGRTVYTTTLHTSRSGMSREIKATVIFDGAPFDISGQVARVTGQRYGNRGGVIVGGAGMDMGFALVYGLSRRLYPDGFDCTGETSCPANDHANDYGEASHRADDNLGIERPSNRNEAWRNEVQRILREELGYREGRHHSDGGYALNHRWL